MTVTKSVSSQNPSNCLGFLCECKSVADEDTQTLIYLKQSWKKRPSYCSFPLSLKCFWSKHTEYASLGAAFILKNVSNKNDKQRCSLYPAAPDSVEHY